MGYSRKTAIDYAKKHWDRPCDDGVFWNTGEAINVEKMRKKLGAAAKDGWEPRFVPDGSGGEEAVFIKSSLTGSAIPNLPGMWEKKVMHPWEGLADCAHFLSKSINAGGVDSSSLAVSVLVNQLRARSDTKTLAEKVPQDKAQRVIDSGAFKEGDIIGYFNISPSGDYGRVNSYTHSTMYVGKDGAGKGRITCHTKSRFGAEYYNDEWFLHSGDYKYTLIHFSADDAPTGATGTFLEGWWKVEYSSRTEYYYFNKAGSVRYTNKAPKSNSPISNPDGSAYWFVDGNEVTITWLNTGTVDHWELLSNKSVLWITVDGVRGTATKVF